MRLLPSCSALVLLAAATPLVAATYTYFGTPFTEAGAPYLIGGRVTGTLTLVQALPPNLAATDIPRADFVDLLFVDGQQVRTGANTVICRLVLGTDANAAINVWNVWMRSSEVGAGNARYSLETYKVPGFTADMVGIGVFANACDSGVLDPRALTQTPGTWVADGMFANGFEG